MQTFRNNLKLLRDTVGLRLPLALFTVVVVLAVALIYSRQQSAEYSSESTDGTYAAADLEDILAAGRTLGVTTKGLCNKLGINFAVPFRGSGAGSDLTRAQGLGMGYSLSIINGTDAGTEQAVVDEMMIAINRGITPVIRLCASQNCDSLKDPREVAKFLARVSDKVCGAEFYVSTGPNEPNAETWLGGNNGDPGSYVPPVGAYSAAMLKSIRALNRPNIKTITHLFNVTQPNFEIELNALRVELGKHGVRLTDFDMFGGNLYNVAGQGTDGSPQPGWGINRYVKRIKDAGVTIPILVTETGMYDRNAGISKDEAFRRLKDELKTLKNDSDVIGYLLFDSFASNTDPSFAYNFLSNEEIEQLRTNMGCSGSTPVSSSQIGPQCKLDLPVPDLSTIPYTPGTGSTSGANSCNTLPETTDTDPSKEYCSANLIDGSFEANGDILQQEGSIRVVKDSQWGWYQRFDGNAGFECGPGITFDLAHNAPADRNPATFCRPPEIIAFSPAGAQCSDGQTSHGNNSMKIFTAQGNMNGGMCLKLDKTITSGKAGFDVVVKIDKQQFTSGDTFLYLGYTDQAYNSINGNNYQSVNWGAPTVVHNNDVSNTKSQTVSVTVNISGAANTVCLRANNDRAQVGIDTFWDGGYVTEGSAPVCKTANEQAEVDGVSRQGGGTACLGSCFPTTQEAIKRSRQEIFNPPANYNLASCEIAPALREAGDYSERDTGKQQPDGSLDGKIRVVNCGEGEETDPNFSCSNPQNVTFGYKVVTTGPKQIPLLNYLSALEKTDDNPFTTYCQLVTHRNFTSEDSALFVNFSNDTTGPFRIFGSDDSVQVEVPKLGTMSACGVVPWDFDDDLYINPKTLFKPNSSYVEATSVDNTGDSPISIFLNAIKNFFNFGGSIDKTVQLEIGRNATINNACQNLPGGGFKYINTADTVNFGEQNIIIRQENIEMSRYEFADGIYLNNGKFDYQNACFNFEGTNDLFKDDGESNLVDSGHMESRTYIVRDPKTDKILEQYEGCVPKTYWGTELGNPSDPAHRRDCFDMKVKDLYLLAKSKNIPITQVHTSKTNKGQSCKAAAIVPYRNSNQAAELPGLGKMIDNLYKLDQSHTIEPIKNINKGIKIKVGFVMYDSQKTVGTSQAVLGSSSIPIEDFEGDYPETFEDFLKKLSIDPKYAQGEIGEIIKKSYKATPYASEVMPANTYIYADYVDNRATAAYYDYFFPWVGNIPAWMERYAFSLSNQNNTGTAKSFQGKFIDLDVFDSAPESYNRNVLLDYCDKTTDPKKDCYISKEQYDVSIDPVATFLRNYQGLESPFVNIGGTTNTNNNGQCIPPSSNTTPVPQPSTTGNCQLDSVMGKVAFPVDGATISNGNPAHIGTDIGVGAGTPLYAVAAGEVVFVRNMDLKDSIYRGGATGGNGSVCFFGNDAAGNYCDWWSITNQKDSIINYLGWWKQYGNVVGIRHADGLTVYAHLKGGSVRVQPGQCVQRNQQIAETGNTGNSSGPHLHFEIRKTKGAGYCNDYIQSCVTNNNTLTPFDAGLSTPRTATSEPIPTGGTVPYCTGGGTGNPGNPKTGSHMCLIKKAVTSINSSGSKMAAEIVYAINMKETSLICPKTWYSWRYEGDRTECNGDPNQTAWTTRNENAGKWDVRGITQFESNTFNSLVSRNEAAMQACIDALGVNGSLDPSLWRDPLSTNPKFSRHRVGDALCAAAIKLAEDASKKYGRLISETDWQNINGIGGEALAYVSEVYYEGPNAYDGNCRDNYCTLTNKYAKQALDSKLFENLNCDGTTLPGNPPSGAINCENAGNPVTVGANGYSTTVKLLTGNARSNYCTVPTRIVIHWSGGWSSNDATYNTLQNRELSCQIGTDQDGSIQQWLPMWENKVELASCTGGANAGTLNNEIVGAFFDTNPPSAAAVDSAVKSTCMMMRQYNIPVEQVYGHNELTPGKSDPGALFITSLRSKISQTCPDQSSSGK